MRPLFLLTDFGLDGYYAGVMKAVVLARQPGASITDLSHGVHPGAVVEGAYLIEAAWEHLPKDGLLLAVIDPGVGSERRILLLRDGERELLVPDNGLATPIAARPGVTVQALAWEKLLPDPASATFHGRDLFAPLAAHRLASPHETLPGPVIDDWVRISGGPRRLADRVEGRVVLVDRFGNLVSDCRTQDLEGFEAALVGGHRIETLARTFSDVAPGAFLVYLGSGGRVEVGLRDGAASDQLAVGAGDPLVLLRSAKPHDR